MNNTFDCLEDELKNANKVSVVCHRRPDGDAISSVLAFGAYLSELGNQFQLYSPDSVPEYLRFLHGTEFFKEQIDDFWNSSDAVVLVDCGDISMPGIDSCYFENKKIFVIDHHASNVGFGYINVIDPQASATCEILYNFFSSVNFIINKEVATGLLCGIYTDTDAFTNLATTPECMKVSSELLALGADFRKMTANTTRNKSISSLKLWGKALERLKIDKNKNIAVTVIRQKDFQECKASRDDAEGVANLLNHLSYVNMSMVLRELEGGVIKGSLRTTKELIDVSQVAKLLGGGGHKKAAGFTIKGKIQERNDGWEIINS